MTEICHLESDAQNSTPLQKRKHKTLTIQEKVELLKLIEEGATVRRLCAIFNVGTSTVYDIKRKGPDLLKYYAEKRSKNAPVVRKTMKEGKCSGLERALVEWFEQQKSESVTVTGGMIVEQAKIFHKKLKIKFKCKYSQGWLEKFKNRHGIKLYTVVEEKMDSDSNECFGDASSTRENDASDNSVVPDNSDDIDNFIKKFNEIVTSEEFNFKQIYTANQTILHWREMPKEIFESEQNTSPSASRDFDDQIAVFTCYNVTGCHRCKLLTVGKNPNPKALNGVKVLPVIYRGNARNSVTKDIVMDWLENHFNAEAKAYWSSLGFDEDRKTLLILDSSLAPSDKTCLEFEKTHVLFLPSNFSASMQPQEQGTSQSLKCWYRLECLASFLEAVTQQKSAEDFRNEFSLKESLWALGRAWENIPDAALRSSWHKLRDDLACADEEEVEEAYSRYKKQIINPVVDCIKRRINRKTVKYICYENIEEWIESREENVLETTRDEQADEILSSDIEEKYVPNEHEVMETEKSVEDCVRLTTDLISGLERQSFIGENEIMHLYRLKANLVAEIFKNRKSGNKEVSKSSFRSKRAPTLRIKEEN